MVWVHADLEGKDFERPSNVVTAKICLDSGKLATDKCENTYTEYFVKGTVPDYCEGHTELEICKQTGKIATEDCPEKEKKVYVTKPEKEETTLWRTDEGDKYDIPTETCNVHAKKEVTIPNVVGKSEAEAKKALEALGLKVKVETKEDSKNVGKVISQNPKANTKSKEGTTITITVGKKKETESKPNNPTNTTNTNSTTNTVTNSTTTNTVTNTTTNNNTQNTNTATPTNTQTSNATV